MVERQPSKLNVEGSSPFSRSRLISGFWGPNPKNIPASSKRGMNPTRSNPNPKNVPASWSWGFVGRRDHLENPAIFAHLAQLVERVLGKDEVTSSILVVGSKPSRSARAPGRASQSQGSILGANPTV